MLEIKKDYYNKLVKNGYAGKYQDLQGKHANWINKKSVMMNIDGKGIKLLIEGIHFIIVK